MATRELDVHAIDRIYIAEPQRGHTERGWVRCPRYEASVPLEQCTRCAHLTQIDRDPSGRPVAVQCPYPSEAPPPPPEGEMRLPAASVSDLMTRNVLCVRPDVSVDSLVELFVETSLRAVPVVDRHGTLLGIVTEADALLDVHARSNHDQPRSSDRQVRDAASIMRGLPLSLPESTSVARAAAVMVFEDASRAVVLSAQGDIVGLLSATDILFWLARSAGYLLPMHGARESP